MGTPVSRKEKQKQQAAAMAVFGGDLAAVAQAILHESEALKSRKTQVRENILRIKEQLLTAHANGMSFDRMAQLLSESGLKCSAPTLREMLGIPKKNGAKKVDQAAEKNSGRRSETAAATIREPQKNQTAELFGASASETEARTTPGKTPAFKTRGDL